ncbi:MAG: FG-GAP repeat domain-containing protein, partial [Bacteroidota bacterium]
MRLIIALLLVLPCGFTLNAQTAPILRLDQRPAVSVQGDSLLFPWTGGFNSIIPVELDFDGDSMMDLFFFDRVGNRISPFRNTGDTLAMPYRYMPEWTSLIPPFHDWVRSADFDCDGDMDLFSYTNAAIGVWRNDFSPGTGLVFTPVIQQLASWYSTFQNPIFVSQVNLPALVDVDGDTDLDIITFSSSSNYLEYHRNYAVDSAGTCNAFRFSLEPYCWGYFKLSGLSNTGLLNQTCRSGVLDTSLFSIRRHAGSVLTPMDQDCDGDVDLLNGDILGENMLFLLNGGTPDSAIITQQDINFPVYDVPVMMQNLPGAYYLDLNNDQMKEMLLSTFPTVGEYFKNVPFDHNTTDNCTNIFQLADTQFVGRQTIDLGTASSPVFFDVDNDGLADMVVGNELYFNTDPALTYSRLAWFRNTGSVTAPAFELADRDWLGLSSLQQYGLAPEFGDVDADGDADLLLGNSDGTLILYNNVAATGQAPQFVFNAPAWQGIDIGNNSQPQLVDVDRDGRLDLLIGERAGVLNYYRNTSPSGPAVFSL